MYKLILTLMTAATITACQYEAPSKEVVGLTQFNIIDHSRVDRYGPNANARRDIMVKVWYPATVPESAKPIHHWYHSEQQPLPLDMGTEPYSPYIQELLNRPSQSYLNATPKGEKHPLVLFSHGYNSTLEGNQLLMEHLARQGYVVVSLGHNHHAQYMTQADGVVTQFDWRVRGNDFYLAPEADVAPKQFNNELSALAGQPLSESDKARVYQLASWAAGDHAILADWVKDTHKTLEVMAQLNSGDNQQVNNASMDMRKFKNRLDLNRVVAVGSSFGGLSSLDFCNQEPRCRGAVNFDAPHYNLQQQGNYHKPYLMMIQGTEIYAPIRLIMEQQQEPIYVINVAGATHFSFGDRIAFGPAPDLGTIDGKKMTHIMLRGVSLFLNIALKGQTHEAALIDWADAQDEVTLTVDH